MALREILAKFGVSFDTAGAQKGKSAVDGLRGAVNGLASAVAGATLYQGIQGMVTGMLDLRAAVTASARDLGTSRGAVQQWEYAAKRSNVSAGDLNSGLQTLKGTLQTLYTTGQRNHPMLQRLGVAARDSKGRIRDTADVFREAGLQLMKIPQGGKRAQMAMQVFGASGAKLLPLFEKGEKGLDALTKQFKELGGALNDETLAALDETHAALVDFEVVSNSLKGQIVAGLTPAFRKMSQGLQKAQEWLQKTGKQSNIMKGLFVSLGAAGAAAGLAMLKPFLPMLVTMALLAILIDEVITFAQGGKTAFEEFLKALGVDQPMIDTLRTDLKELFDEIDRAPTVGGKFEAAFNKIGGTLKTFFSDDIPAAWDQMWKDINDSQGTGGATIGDFFENALKNLGDVAYEGGLNIVESWINGLLDSLPIAQAAMQAVKAIFDELKEGGGVGGAKSTAALEFAKRQAETVKVMNQVRRDTRKFDTHLEHASRFGEIEKRRQDRERTMTVDTERMNALLGTTTQAAVPGQTGVDQSKTVTATNTVNQNITIQASEDAASDVRRAGRQGIDRGINQVQRWLEATI